MSWVMIHCIMIHKILGKSHICSITCITQITHFPFALTHFCIYFLKPIVNTTDMEQRSNQEQFETYDYIFSNLPEACVNDCLKVILHDFVRSLKLICLGMDFLDYLDQQSTDLLFHTNMPKHLTLKY